MTRRFSFLFLIPIILFAAENIYQGKSVEFNSLKDAVLDVGLISISSPSDTVDSNSIILPTVTVKNFGDTTVSFSVLFKDLTLNYIDTKEVTALPPDSAIQVQFSMWRVRLMRGTQFVKCSTQLNDDVNNTNDALQKSFFCRVKDISLLELFIPDTVDSGTIITPRLRLKNLGNTRESFLTTFKVGTAYRCSIIVRAPAPMAETVINFLPWPSDARGTHPVVCTTSLIGDVNPNDNFLFDTITIQIKDFGISEIFDPASIVPENSPIYPKVLVVNNGNTPGSAKVFFTISDSLSQLYIDSLYTNLEPEASDTLTFTVFNVTHGRYIGKAYIKVTGDINPRNDTMIRYFFAGIPNRDVGVINIIQPVGSILKNPIRPKAEIMNYGDFPETFYTYFKILDSGSQVYLDSIPVIGLQPGRTSQLTFSLWNPYPGNFTTESYTALENDLHPENDLLTNTVIIETLDIGWIKLASVPEGSNTKPKPVKAGGALAFVPPTSIYAFKGNNTNEFFCYDITSNSWTEKETIPWLGKKKRVKDGAGLCYDNRYFIYATKGKNTQEFWRYNIQTDSWTKLRDVPFGTNPRQKKVKKGSCITFFPRWDNQNFVYLLKANSTSEFFAYWIEEDSWIIKPDAPSGPKQKKFKAGSCITYDQHNFCIWALKGGTNEFYAYDLIHDNWLESKPDIPLVGLSEKKKKVKDGGGIAYSTATRSVYALKGGNTNEFWRYNTQDSTWTQELDMEQGDKRIKSGGALVFANGNLFALRGNKTYDFYIYNFGSGIGIEEPKINKPVPIFNSISLRIQPNPFAKSTRIFYTLNGTGDIKIPVSIKLYNVTGQMVKVLVDGKIYPGTYNFDFNSAKLPKGIYLVRLTTLNRQASQKIIITGE